MNIHTIKNDKMTQKESWMMIIPTVKVQPKTARKQTQKIK